MKKSHISLAMDTLQKTLDPLFQGNGFRKAGRCYRRSRADGMAHIVSFAISRWVSQGDPWADFSMKLGVFVPEVRDYAVNGKTPPSPIQECDCCFTLSFNDLSPEASRVALKTDMTEWQINQLAELVQTQVLLFFDRFDTRQQVLEEIACAGYTLPASSFSPLGCDGVVTAAIIHARLGNTTDAMKVLMDAIERVQQRSLPRLVSELNLIATYRRHTEALSLTSLPLS